MNDPHAEIAEASPFVATADSSAPAAKPSPKVALPTETELLTKMLWTVPETAFLLRVGVRSVWRMAADPESGFPTPKRLRGRTLFARDAVLAFLNGRGGGAR